MKLILKFLFYYPRSYFIYLLQFPYFLLFFSVFVVLGRIGLGLNTIAYLYIISFIVCLYLYKKKVIDNNDDKIFVFLQCLGAAALWSLIILVC